MDPVVTESNFEKECIVHRPRIYHQCFVILRNGEDAEDATQQTFMQAWRHLSVFRKRSAFFTWLYRIAVNESLMILRTRTKIIKNEVGLSEAVANHNSERVEIPTSFDSFQAPIPDPLAVYSRSEARHVMRVCLNDRHEDGNTRRAFADRYLNEMTIVETAGHLGTSEITVRVNSFRVKLLVRKRMKRLGYRSSRDVL